MEVLGTWYVQDMYPRWSVVYPWTLMGSTSWYRTLVRRFQHSRCERMGLKQANSGARNMDSTSAFRARRAPGSLCGLG
jgi:hypothetical protein